MCIGSGLVRRRSLCPSCDRSGFRCSPSPLTSHDRLQMIRLLSLLLPLVVLWLTACIGRGLVRCCLIGRDPLGHVATGQVPLPTRHGIRSLLLLCAYSFRLLPPPAAVCLGDSLLRTQVRCTQAHRAFGYERHPWCERLPDGRIQR